MMPSSKRGNEEPQLVTMIRQDQLGGGGGAMMPSSFMLGGGGGGGLNLKSGLVGAAAGGIMFALCKSKCPGSTGGILSNLPGMSALKGISGGLLGLQDKGKAKADIAEKDAEIAKLKAEVAAAKSGGEGEEGKEAVPEPTAEEKAESDAKSEAEAKEAKLHGELLKGENSACRLNCKIKSLMVAAAAAGAMSLMSKKASVGGMDKWTAGPVFAALDLDVRKTRRCGPCQPNKKRRNNLRFLDFEGQVAADPALEASVPEATPKAAPEKLGTAEAKGCRGISAASLPKAPPTEWHEFLRTPAMA